MKDVKYIQDLLTTNYPTQKDTEEPYPPLEAVIISKSFNLLAGTVEGEVSNGKKSREGNPYLCFNHGKKRILSHRFIMAVALEKWIPRECDIDHFNHNPSDNRPYNLRIVTSRDNAGNRRTALLSELVDVDKANNKLTRKKAQLELISKPQDGVFRQFYDNGSLVAPTYNGSIPDILYTGETRPGIASGVFYKTNQGSWHFFEDGEYPIQQHPIQQHPDYDDIPF